MRWIIVLVLAALLVAAGWAPATRRMRAFEEGQRAAALIEKAHASISAGLKDPASAQWRYDKVPPGKSFVCGQLNAKNSMGGYVGFKRYIFATNGYMIEGSSRKTWSFEDAGVSKDILHLIDAGDKTLDSGIEEKVDGVVFSALNYSICLGGDAADIKIESTTTR